MAVYEFSLKVGDTVVSRFAVAEKLVSKGLGSEGKTSFKKICKVQPHPCQGCGAGSILRFFLDNTYHENYDRYELCVKGFVYMCKELGLALNPKSLFHSVQLEDLGKIFNFFYTRLGVVPC